MQRKRPVGSEWSKFVDAWGKADHDGKVLLAEKFKVSYDMAKLLFPHLDEQYRWRD